CRGSCMQPELPASIVRWTPHPEENPFGNPRLCELAIHDYFHGSIEILLAELVTLRGRKFPQLAERFELGDLAIELLDLPMASNALLRLGHLVQKGKSHRDSLFHLGHHHTS